jgi:hypothetical protein
VRRNARTCGVEIPESNARSTAFTQKQWTEKRE